MQTVDVSSPYPSPPVAAPCFSRKNVVHKAAEINIRKSTSRELITLLGRGTRKLLAGAAGNASE